MNPLRTITRQPPPHSTEQLFMLGKFANLFSGFDDDGGGGDDDVEEVARPRRAREEQSPPALPHPKRAHLSSKQPSATRASDKPGARVYDVPQDDDDDDVYMQSISGDSVQDVDDVHFILPQPSFTTSAAPYPTYSAPMELPEDIREAVRPKDTLEVMRRGGPPEDAYRRTQAVQTFLHRSSRYRFAVAVAGAIGQGSADLLLDKASVAMASAILTRRTAELQQNVRTFTDRAESLAAETQRSKVAADTNAQSIARLLGKSLPELGSGGFSKEQAIVLRKYVSALAEETPDSRTFDEFRAIAPEASALLDRVLDAFSRASQLNALQDASAAAPPLAGDRVVDSATTVFDQVRYLVGLLGGPARAKFIAPESSGTSAKVDMKWGAGRLVITLNPPSRVQGVAFFIRDDQQAEVPPDTDGSEADTRARDIRTAFTFIARTVDSVPIRSVEKTPDAVAMFSNFVLSALGGRVIEYDKVREEDMERKLGIKHSGVLTAENKSNVLQFVRDVDSGQPFSTVADMLVLSAQPPRKGDNTFPPTSLFNWEDAYYTRVRDMMSLYVLTSDEAPSYLVNQKAPKWSEQWNRAAVKDPRIALLKLFTQYNIVRHYIRELVNQMFQIPDTYHLRARLDAEDTNKRDLDRDEGILDRISRMRYDGADYAGLPQISGMISYNAQLSTAISQSAQWIRLANPNFGLLEPMRDVIDSGGDPTHAHDLPAGDPYVAFYMFFVQVVAWHLRGNPVAVYMTTNSVTDRHVNEKNLVLRLRQFDMRPDGRIVLRHGHWYM